MTVKPQAIVDLIAKFTTPCMSSMTYEEQDTTTKATSLVVHYSTFLWTMHLMSKGARYFIYQNKKKGARYLVLTMLEPYCIKIKYVL